MGGLRDALADAGLARAAHAYLLATLLSPLLCLLLRYGPSTERQRHAVSAGLGLGLCLFCFGPAAAAWLLAPALVTHAVVATRSRLAAPLVLAGCWAFLVRTHTHAARDAAASPGAIDSTGALMVLVLKLVSVAFDVADGRRAAAAAAAAAAPSPSRPRPAQPPPPTPHQAACALPGPPGLLPFLGYAFFPGSALAGPWLPFAEYRDWAARTGAWAAAGEPPSGWASAAASAALRGLVAAGMHAAVSPRFPGSVFRDPRWVASTSLPGKVGYMWAMGFASRCKYYFAWLWGEAACIAAGLGWSGREEGGEDGNGGGRPSWGRATNVDVLGVELAGSASHLAAKWNSATGRWLRHYAYERLAPPPPAGPARAPFWALLLTQVLASLWHGTAPGYAFFFVGSAFMFQASKVVFRVERRLPPRSFSRRLFGLCHGVLSSFHLNYNAAAFLAGDLEGCLAAWRSVGHLGTVTMVAIVALGAVPRAAWRRLLGGGGGRGGGGRGKAE